VRSRDRCTNEIATLTVALEAVQAEIRAAEAKLEALRSEHYAAGDALHDKQGAFYAANAEVTRLEQQLSFARESETRIAQQLTQLTEAIAAIGGQETALADERTAADAALQSAAAAREEAQRAEQATQAELPALDAAVQGAEATLSEHQQSIATAEQALRVAETRRESAIGGISELDARKSRLAQELAGIAAPATDFIRELEEQLAQENADLAGKQEALVALQKTVETLQVRQGETADAWQRDSKALADLEATQQALAALQARIGHGTDIDGWLAEHGLDRARRLWQVIDIEPGWEDALEAVLRERLSALELDRLDEVTEWVADGAQPPRRLAAYAPAPARHRSDRATRRAAGQGAHEARKTCRAWWPTGWLACAAATTSRQRSPSVMRSPSAKRSSRPRVISSHRKALRSSRRTHELHGVLARQRELDELDAGWPVRAAREEERERSAMPSTPSSLPHSRRITPKGWR
jgi:chromosome segregation protein